MKIRWLSTAENDLIALVNYIAENNPQIALKILSTIHSSIEKLKIFPYIGREGRVDGTRELIITYYPLLITHYPLPIYCCLQNYKRYFNISCISYFQKMAY